MIQNSKNVVDLFDMEAVEAASTFQEKKGRNDGMYKPIIKDAVDKSKGYCSIIRFLPNLKEDMTLGSSSIEREVYYVRVPEYMGYYDIQKPFVEKCPLNTLQTKLKYSKNAAEVEQATLFNYQKKYHSYVLIVEDEQHPELVGKIMVFQYGAKIKEKIEQEKLGNNAEEEKCNIFDIVRGKDFKLVIKQIGDFPNYDSSLFKSVSPLKIWDEKKGKLVPIDTKDPNVKTKVNEFLLNRDVTLEDHEPKVWTSTQRDNVNALISMFMGKKSVDTYSKPEKTKTQSEHFEGDPDYELDPDAS